MVCVCVCARAHACAGVCAYHSIMVKLICLLHDIKDTINIQISYSLNSIFAQENYAGLGSFINL
jgi:hypothetical protein